MRKQGEKERDRSMDLTRIHNFNRSIAAKQRPKTGHTGALANTEAHNANYGDAYIVMPPKDEGIFKSQVSRTQELKDFGVQIKEDLGFVGGHLAELNEKQVKELEKRGYTLVKDSPKPFLPPVPLKPLEGDDMPKMDGLTVKEPEKVEEFKERPEMTESRFTSNLSKRFTGKGVTIAVIDTGVFPHPDLSPNLLGQVDFVAGRPIPYDDNGHGTHVAGDAAGSGMIDERFAGPAKDAQIFAMKVLGEDGSGRTSDIVKALQFAVENKDALNIRVINMSLGHTASKDYENDPVNIAVKAAKEAGIVVLAAAGNEGPDRKTIAAPGDSPDAITVGAAADNNTKDPSDDKMAEFSSRGPTPGGLTKPDLVAPGVSIVAPLAPAVSKEAVAKQFKMMHGALKFYSEMPYEQLKEMPPETFMLMGLSPQTVLKMHMSEESAQTEFNRLLNATSRMQLDETGASISLPGTSMATPIVAGVVAQMLEANPDLTPDQVKEILMATADKLPDGRLGANTQGAGMVDPDEAIRLALDTEGKRNEAPQLISDMELIAKLMEQAGIELPPAEQPPAEGEPDAEPPAEEEKPDDSNKAA